MPRFLITVNRPDDFECSAVEAQSMSADIDALNLEMTSAGIRLFVGGLQSLRSATSLRRNRDGEVTITAGRLHPGPEQVDGFWVIEASNQQEALAWAIKAASACRASIEVRPFNEH
jgi:hypothetical protein